jgi:micrococcal nuclease
MMTEFLFHYMMRVTRVVDGDTVYGDVDLGFNFGSRKMEFRMSEINTPEMHGENREAGLASKAFVEERILEKDVIIVTKRDTKEKYGRYLAHIYYQKDNEWICLNQELVESNHAVPYMV